jgi:hypothetical protein
MKTVTELQTEYKAKLESIASEKRSMSEAEVKELDAMKSAIDTAKNEETLNAKKSALEVEMRSIREAQDTIKSKLDTVDKNTYLRSIAKGSADVGNKEVVADVVRAYVSQSPLYAAHQNVQVRSTGNAYSFTQITGGGTGYVKTEGNAGTADDTTAAAMVSQAFKLYSGQKIVISQEALDDFAADIAQEITSVSLAQSVMAFAADAYTALNTITKTDTASTSWALTDITGAYLALPARNLFGVKYIMNGTTAASVVDLLDYEDNLKAAFIGLDKSNIIIDSSCTSGTIYVGNPTLALAIGRKDPIRIFVQEVSEGKSFEAQPRLAVALRDATAMKKLVLRAS